MKLLGDLKGWVLAPLVAVLPACTPPAPPVLGSALPASAVMQPLLGSTPSVLAAEFGQPILRRVDGTSQIWLYHSQVCGLNLILFPDNTGTSRVMDAVPDNGDAASCAASLIRQPVQAASMERGAAS